jgi:anti-anti-sigma factor
MGTRGLRIEVEERPGETRLRLAGELDLLAASTVRRAVRSRVAPSGRLTLDLGGVTFIDVAGLGVVLQALEHAGGAGARVTLGGDLPPGVERLARLAGVLGRLPLDGRAA